MMSYLWILLLGSLLATHAKAQDDINPTAEPSAETTTSKADVEVIDQHNLGEAVTAAEEALHTVSQPEPTADPETGIIQEANAADVSTEPAATDAPAGEEGQSVSPTTGATEPVISEAPTTTQAADSEDNAPETTQTAVNEEEQATTNANTAPAQDNSGLHDIMTTVGLEVNEEAPTDPSTNEESSTDDFRALPDDNVTMNPGFNLEVVQEETSVTILETHGLTQENPMKQMPRRKLGAPILTEDEKEEGPDMGASERGQQAPSKTSSSALAGILSAIVVSAVGAIAGYFTYQQKKLCFKNRQEADPEAAHKADAAEARSDPQVLSTLLNSS